MSCLMIDVASLSLDSNDIKRISHPLVGGVILFSRNYENKKQLKSLVKSIRKIKHNILIAVDHEGGRVQRFRDDFTQLPAMALLGSLFDKDPDEATRIAKLCGWLIAKELGGCDIDFSFTPVLDVNYESSSVIGNRAFHKEIQPTIHLANSLTEGLGQAGMQGVGKHFPGHGFIKADTHLEVGEDERAFEVIKESDMLVFKALIENGLKGIMPSHVIYSLCDDKPSGLSHFWLQDQLRKSLGFNGAIFSDDMSMQAAVFTEKNVTKRVLKALQAGCDMVLVCNAGEDVDIVLTHLDWPVSKKSQCRIKAMGLNKKKNEQTQYMRLTTTEAGKLILKFS